MNIVQAKLEINRIFSSYGVNPNLPTGKGKIYELYCLGLLMEELSSDGFSMTYHGPNPATFKAGPGLIHKADPHFDLSYSGVVYGQIYLNIEFRTLGATQTPHSDRSCWHELDVVIVEDGVTGRPDHDDVLMGLECKSSAKFNKGILKETLGVRREMTLLARPQDSSLTQICSSRGRRLNCDPPSEYRLCYIDLAGSNYSASSDHFGIELTHWEP